MFQIDNIFQINASIDYGRRKSHIILFLLFIFRRRCSPDPQLWKQRNISQYLYARFKPDWKKIFTHILAFTSCTHGTAITAAESKYNFRIIIDTPYLAFTSELWSAYCEDFGENCVITAPHCITIHVPPNYHQWPCKGIVRWKYINLSTTSSDVAYWSPTTDRMYSFKRMR